MSKHIRRFVTQRVADKPRTLPKPIHATEPTQTILDPPKSDQNVPKIEKPKDEEDEKKENEVKEPETDLESKTIEELYLEGHLHHY